MIIGPIIIQKNVFVAPFAVIRQDEKNEQGQTEPVLISRDCNIQDGVVIHSIMGAPVSLGHSVTLAHRAIVHGPADIGNGVFIGFNSIVSAACIGENSIIRHGATVENCELPPNTLVPSGTVVDENYDIDSLPAVDQKNADFQRSVVATNVQFSKDYILLASSEN